MELVFIDEKYTDFLRKIDEKVSFNVNLTYQRPYVGVLLNVGDKKYFAPLTSSGKSKKLCENPKQESVTFLPIENCMFGGINFNNMIPVVDGVYWTVELEFSPKDNKFERAKKFKLQRANRFIRKNKDLIIVKAKHLYNLYLKNKLFQNVKDITCDFKKLEEQASSWRNVTKLEFIPIKTRIVNPPKDEIWDIIDALYIEDGDIVFITSKILGIHQSRCLPDTADKEVLIKQECSRFLPYTHRAGFEVSLTVVDNILMANAGIDESNADGHYILWPKGVDKLCGEIRKRLMKKHGVKKLGVVSTDSHTTPLRWGVTGITTGLAGVEPLRDLRGESDIFGRKMGVTKVNIIDALAGAAVLCMGEAAEQIPIVILRGFEGIKFSDTASMKDFTIAPEDDLYSPLLDVMEKVK